MSKNKIVYALFTGFNFSKERLALLQRVIVRPTVNWSNQGVATREQAKKLVTEKLLDHGFKDLTFVAWVENHTAYFNGENDVFIGELKGEDSEKAR